MKVYVNVIDERTGGYQFEMIDEPVVKGKELENALMHLGVSYGSVEWKCSESDYKFGKIEGTSKVVSVVLTNFND